MWEIVWVLTLSPWKTSRDVLRREGDASFGIYYERRIKLEGVVISMQAALKVKEQKDGHGSISRGTEERRGVVSSPCETINLLVLKQSQLMCLRHQTSTVD